MPSLHSPTCLGLVPASTQHCSDLPHRPVNSDCTPAVGGGPRPTPPATPTLGQPREVSTGLLPPLPLSLLSTPSKVPGGCLDDPDWSREPRASPDQEILPKAAKHLLTGQGLGAGLILEEAVPKQSLATLPGCAASDNSLHLSEPSRFPICYMGVNNIPYFNRVVTRVKRANTSNVFVVVLAHCTQ